MFGRRTIYTSANITEQNIIEEVNSALVYHVQNLLEMEYLYWYRRNVQPILNRTKERNEFINNKVLENHAEEIVAFKNGYFLTQPAFYISRNEESQEKVDLFNEYLYRSGKQQVDNEVVDWFHTVGKGAIFVKSIDDIDKPYEVYCLDPRSAFVVYSMSPGNRPIMGVNLVTIGDKLLIDVWTEDYVYRLNGATTGTLTIDTKNYIATATDIIEVTPNFLHKIPIIEYQYSTTGMSAFEPALSLLDSLNTVSSNRVDGLEQQVQSLVVLYNAKLAEGEDAKTLRKSGLLLLKSVEGNHQDVKLLSEEINQTQTQTLVDYLREQISSICAMPRVSTGSTYDTTGAAVLANFGWYQADAAARNTEDLFKKSNRYFDEIVLLILNQKGLLDLKLSDIELNFVRNETANVMSKAQAFQILLASGMHPELAAAKSGISNDPVSDIKMSEDYLKMIWGDPEKKGEAEIIERTNETDNDTGGAV